MDRGKRLGRLFFDWMGVLLVVCLAVLAFTGAWGKGDALQEELPVSPVAAGAAAPADGTGTMLIVVDAGHGGADGGAQTPDGVPEAGINLTVAKMVESRLREAGFAVVMTRTDEKALGKDKKKDMAVRRDIMRGDGVVAVVSIHMNKFRDTGIGGPMAFYMKGSEEGAALATCVIQNVCNSIGNPVRDANPGDYFVLRESVAPAVIVECGFLSNTTDAALLQDRVHQQKLADGIVAGVAAYFSGSQQDTGTQGAADTLQMEDEKDSMNTYSEERETK